MGLRLNQAVKVLIKLFQKFAGIGAEPQENGVSLQSFLCASGVKESVYIFLPKQCLYCLLAQEFLTLFSLPLEAQRKKLCKKEMPIENFARCDERRGLRALDRAAF